MVKCLKTTDFPSGCGPWEITKHRLLTEGEVLLELDGCFEVVVDAQTFYSGSWQDGDKISQTELTQLLEARKVEKAYERVLKFLSYRSRTEAEIRRYLARFHLSGDATEKMVSKLSSLGLVDDRKFIEMWLEDRMTTRPVGMRRIMFELVQKGIEKSLIAEKLEELSGKFDEQKIAIQLAQKQARRYPQLDKRNKTRKLTGFLQRRGFSYDVVRKAVQVALGEDMEILLSSDNLDSQ